MYAGTYVPCIYTGCVNLIMLSSYLIISEIKMQLMEGCHMFEAPSMLLISSVCTHMYVLYIHSLKEHGIIRTSNDSKNKLQERINWKVHIK